MQNNNARHESEPFSLERRRWQRRQAELERSFGVQPGIPTEQAILDMSSGKPVSDLLPDLTVDDDTAALSSCRLFARGAS